MMTNLFIHNFLIPDDMMDKGNISIIERLHRLKDAVTNSCVDPDPTNGNLYLLAQDKLFDAFITLYDECNNDCFKNDPQIYGFVEKCKNSLPECQYIY